VRDHGCAAGKPLRDLCVGQRIDALVGDHLGCGEDQATASIFRIDLGGHGANSPPVLT
jgi:hypothetical protein